MRFDKPSSLTLSSPSIHFQLKLYTTVIDDVIHSVSDSFLDEGVDEQVLQELKQMWTTKMLASKAVEQQPERVEVPPPNVAKVTRIAVVNCRIVKINQTLLRFQSGVLNKGGNKNSQANGAKSKAQQQRAATSVVSQDSHTTNGNTAPNAVPQSAGAATGTTPAATGASSTGAAASSGNPATGANNTSTNHLLLDPYKLIPIQITLPPQGDAESRVLTIQLPGSVIQNNQLGQMLTATVIQSIMNLPPALASSVLQQHVNTTLQNNALQSEWDLFLLLVSHSTQCALIKSFKVGAVQYRSRPLLLFRHRFVYPSHSTMEYFRISTTTTTTIL